MAVECPRCGSRRSWLLRDGRRRCARCRLDWRPGRLPLRLSRAEWRVLLTWFVRGAPSAEIARETGLERKRVLRALGVVREAMQRASARARHAHAPEPPTDLGRRRAPARRPRRLTVLGIYAVDGEVGADVLSSDDVDEISRVLRQGRTVDVPLPESLEPYVAVVIRGRLHRLPRPGSLRAPFGQIEAFWAYLQRHLRTKGGIRPARLDLYLAEYSWRYAHRRLTASEQVSVLMKLVRTASRWTGWDYAVSSTGRHSGESRPSHPIKH